MIMMMTKPAVAITTTILSTTTTGAVDAAAVLDRQLRSFAVQPVSVYLLRTASGRLAATAWPGPWRIRRPTRIG